MFPESPGQEAGSHGRKNTVEGGRLVVGICAHTVTGCVLPCPGMWGLVNNAGISTFGEVEFTSMETYKEVAEVNLWGTVRTTKSFLPLLRRAKGKLGRRVFLPTPPCACQHPW